MTSRILTLFLFIGQISFAQSNTTDCTKKLDQELLILKGGNDSLSSDIKVFQQCGNLDSIDTKIFCSGPALGMMMINLTNEHKKITYREILILIERARSAPEYEQLKKLGVPEFSKAPPTVNKLECEEFVDVEDAIKKSKAQNKLALIFFTGFSCANAIKMEQTVLSDENIKTILRGHYLIYRANVDDKTKLEDKTTVGNKNLKIQMGKFNQESQPYFVVVDYKGRLIADMRSTNSVSEFMDFLNKGLSKK